MSIAVLAWLGLFAQSAGAATLTVSVEGFAGAAGAVTGANGAIDCSGPPSTGTCRASFPAGTRLTLRATPDPGSGFNGWLTPGAPHDCQGLIELCAVWLSSSNLLSDDRLVIATFAPSDSLGQCGSGWGRYVVVFQDFVTHAEPLARAQVAEYGGMLGFIYEHALKGYSAAFPRDVVSELADEPTVKLVSPDEPITLFGGAAGASGAIGEFGAAVCGDEQVLTAAPTEPKPDTNLDTPPPVHPPNAGDPSHGAVVTRGAALTRCKTHKAHRRGRCVRKRALARRICRSRRGKVTPRCTRRMMRKLTQKERQRVRAALQRPG